MLDTLEILKALSGPAAAIGLGIGLVQYGRAQRWKKAEFVAAQIKDFEANVLVRRAMKMLDFRDSHFVVDGRAIHFNSDILARALPYESMVPESPPDEAEIRLAFCDFFDGLERLHHFVEAELITADHLKPYLPYWFRRFTTTHCKPQEFVDSIWTFIDGYEYTGVRALAGMFGFAPPGPKQATQRTDEWLKKQKQQLVGAGSPAAKCP